MSVPLVKVQLNIRIQLDHLIVNGNNSKWSGYSHVINPQHANPALPELSLLELMMCVVESHYTLRHTHSKGLRNVTLFCCPELVCLLVFDNNLLLHKH